MTEPVLVWVFDNSQLCDSFPYEVYFKTKMVSLRGIDSNNCDQCFQICILSLSKKNRINSSIYSTAFSTGVILS